VVRLRFETDLATSLKAAADLEKAVTRNANAFSATAAEAKKLEMAAARIVQQNLTPQEKYNLSIEKMARAVKAGRMTMEEASIQAGRLRTKLDELSRSQQSVFGAGALANMKSYLTGIVGISSAISLFRSEMDAIRAEAEKTTQAQLGAGAARDQLKRNISVLGVPAARKFEERAGRLAAELGLPQSKVDIALGEAFSAGGDVEGSFERVRLAGRFLKTAPEELGGFAGSLGDISKGTGDKDALRNLGFLLTISAQSRLTKASASAANVPPALAGAAAFGARGEESGGLYSALSVAIGDIEGRITGTAIIQATRQLSDFFDERIKKGKSAKGIDTFAERLQQLRADPKLAREFFEGASFESKAIGPLRNFFTDPGSEIAREYEKNIRSFGTAEQQRAIARQTIDYLSEGRFAQTAAIDRTIASKVEQFQLTQDSELTTEAREKIIERASRISGQYRTAQRFQTLFRTGATLSPEEAISELETAFTVANRVGQAVDPELAQNTREMIAELKAIRNAIQPALPPKPSGRPE
jgi:hypothetical protein